MRLQTMKYCKKLNDLPKDVQNEVIETLKAWTGCYVDLYDDGHYEVSTGISLVNSTLPYDTIAYIRNSEIFTPEEIVEHEAKLYSEDKRIPFEMLQKNYDDWLKTKI